MPVRPLLALAAFAAATGAAAAPVYHSAGRVALGAPDRWDYVVADSGSGRVYVAHGDRVTVVDGRAGKVAGEVTGIAGGPHGIGIAGKLGVTDDGKSGEAVVFDASTLAVLRRIPAGEDADGIAVDAASGRAFVADGDPGTVSIVDPAVGSRVATVQAGEEVEYLAAGEGRIFVAGKAKGDVVVIDERAGHTVTHWALPDCAKPHGLAIDRAGHRVFVGCVNANLVVLDDKTGRIVSVLPIGRGSDAVAWDPGRRRVFSANGLDGTISVIEQETPDRYRPLEPIATQVSGRTMAVDARTGRLFVVAGELIADGSPRGHIRPGSLTLMMFDPQ